MEFTEYLKLSNWQQQEIYSDYKQQPINYRLTFGIEDYIYEFVKCECCDEWIPDNETVSDAYEEFGFECLCESCYEQIKEDMR